MTTQATATESSSKEPSWIDALLSWHAETRQHRPGDLAQLRRCADPLDAVFHRGFHRLRREILKTTGTGTIGRNLLCLIAVLAAHTKQHQAWTSIGKAMVGQGPGIPVVNEHRVRQLISEQDRLQACTLILRILPLFKQVVDLAKLSTLIVYWGEKARRNLAFDYFDHLLPHLQTKGDRS